MKPNHEYLARRMPDGTHEIRDLDVFPECSRVNPHTGELDVFDANWLLAAAERANQREADGHVVPAHLGFHDPARETEPPFAGFLRDIRCATEGDHQVLRATLTNVPPEVFEAIQHRRLPYRSVELVLPGEPEISSLALLESTVPFFKFPITEPEA